ncbi:CHASE domain-containing protein [Undibacterium sp.]|uniref:CHASE domain-containing protein n=1 Tax=Undibacterium sp. TaxID=1914977 RepID=UPI003753B95A
MTLLQGLDQSLHMTRLPWWARSSSLWGVLLCSIILTGLAWEFSNRRVQARDEERFANIAQESHTAIVRRMQQYQQFLNDGVGLFRASDEVSRQQWHDFVENANVPENLPGIQNMAVDFAIQAKDLPKHIASVRAEGFSDYTVKPVAPEREIYHSLVYVEPFAGRNLRAFGFDMYTNDIRRVAMDRAIDQGLPSASAAVKLVQETNEDVQYGFIFCLPVYHKNMPVSTVAERRAALRALVSSAFRMKDLMRGIFSDTLNMADLEIFGNGTIAESNRMYSSVAHPVNAVQEFSKAIPIEVGGQTWLLRFTGNAQFIESVKSWQSWVILSAGILFNGLLFFMIKLTVNREKNAIRSGEDNANMFKAVMDCTPSYVHVRDLQGRYVYVNKEYERVFSCTNLGLRGTHYEQILQPELASDVRRTEAMMLETGQSVSTENRIKIEGNEYTYLVNRSPLFDSQGHTIGTCGVGINITELKRLEKEMEDAFERLRVSEERWSFAIEGSGDGVWDWDIVNSKVEFSRRWREMLGYSEDEVGEELHEWSSSVHPDDMPNVMRDMQSHFEQKNRLYLNEHRVLCKDGHYKWILDRGMVVNRDVDGKPIRMVGTHTDISDRKEMERIKSEFISTVSHELRTPVTSIRGSLGLIESGALGAVEPKILELVKIANRNSQRLIVLVNDILDMEKLLSGKMSLHLKEWNPIEMIKQCLDENAAYAAGFSVSYHLTSQEDNSDVIADFERSKQVLTNLLSNAAKFSNAGASVNIMIEQQAHQIKISVIDQGKGIPLSFQARIFEAFAQADSGNTRQQGSTGLGLHISKRMVEQMQGEMGFDSVEGEGTTFWFTLPKAAAI